MPDKNYNQTPFLEAAMERFKLSADSESDIRNKALDDLKFSVGDQWPQDILSRRKGSPSLVLNRMHIFIRHVVNEQREQRPSIQVNPRGDGATVESAEFRQGMIRHIEVSSEAKIAYDTAFDMMVRIGFGYFRLRTDYLDGEETEQEIRIERIKNPFTVFFDPFASEVDYSDANFAFIIRDIKTPQFKHQFPKSEMAKLSSLADFASIGNSAPGWASAETIRIAEYFYVKETKHTDYELSDGGIAHNEEERKRAESFGLTVVGEHERTERQVKWAKITAMDVLEQKDWAGRWIPIIPVLGEDLDIDGKRHLAGMVRNARDPQRMYNYWISAATELIALMPKAPFIGAEGQFEGHEGKWEQANRISFAYLEYKPQDVQGKPVGPPQRQTLEPPVQAMLAMTAQADNDLKATMGIYDASLGQRGPQESGKAILARQQQSNIATLNYADNLSRAIRFCGRMLLDLIPKIYDTPRIQRIVKPDSTMDSVVIFKGPGQQPQAKELLTDKIRKAFDVEEGKYDVTISVGPSFQSRRQEAVASQLQFIEAFPASAQLIGDLVARDMDWPGSKEIADRLHKALPSNLQDTDEGDPAIQLQQAQAQLQQTSTMLEKANELVQQQAGMIKNKRVEQEGALDMKKMELESKERIATLKNETEIALAQLNAGTQGALENLKAVNAEIDRRQALLDADKPVGEGVTSA